MQIEETFIKDVKIIIPDLFEDHRGFFVETWNRERFEENGIILDFVQDNQSYSQTVGTLRGLHFQKSPFAQGKLVRVLKGSILDVAVDLRTSSPTYKQHVSVELSAKTQQQLLIPVGFAHGFITLEPDTEVAYKVTAPYSRECDAGIAWNDPVLGIHWPLPETGPIISEKDAQLPSLDKIAPCF